MREIPVPRSSAALLALVAKLEAATGPDGALEVEIADALDFGSVVPFSAAIPTCRHTPSLAVYFTRESGRVAASTRDRILPMYTASIDAALTLVPPGYEWSRHRGANGQMTMQLDGGFSGGVQAQAATPALALCIAALKARAAMLPSVGLRPKSST